MLTPENVALVAALLAFVASVLAAGVSIYAARFQRFVSERWWDRKADAYTAIIDALAALVETGERDYNEMISIEKISDAARSRLQKQWRQGNAAVARATHVGAFLISERARDALKSGPRLWRQIRESIGRLSFNGIWESTQSAYARLSRLQSRTCASAIGVEHRSPIVARAPHPPILAVCRLCRSMGIAIGCTPRPTIPVISVQGVDARATSRHVRGR